MSIFDNIMEKLGMKKKAPIDGVKEPPKQAVPNKPYTPAPPPQGIAQSHGMPSGAYTPPPPQPKEMDKVDLVAHLDNLAKNGPIKGLNWRVSINDLMALIGLEHSSKAIKDLAVELGCPEKEMGDSYSRNVWTHKALLKKLAENGGNVPKELLD
jgi:hypothetical protein